MSEVLACRPDLLVDNRNAFTVEHAFHAARLAHTVLDPLRERLGSSIRITSWFRSPKVNAAVDGAGTSEHMTGGAADIAPSTDMREAFDLLAGLPYGQRIIYIDKATGKPRWIHVSIKLRERPAKEQALVCVVSPGLPKSYREFTGFQTNYIA